MACERNAEAGEAIARDGGIDHGGIWGVTTPATRHVRRWPVKDFESWLIFYQPRRYGVEIVRIIHGARNIKALLDE
jgi:hypothetical protein